MAFNKLLLEIARRRQYKEAAENIVQGMTRQLESMSEGMPCSYRFRRNYFLFFRVIQYRGEPRQSTLQRRIRTTPAWRPMPLHWQCTHAMGGRPLGWHNAGNSPFYWCGSNNGGGHLLSMYLIEKFDLCFFCRRRRVWAMEMDLPVQRVYKRYIRFLFLFFRVLDLMHLFLWWFFWIW